MEVDAPDCSKKRCDLGSAVAMQSSGREHRGGCKGVERVVVWHHPDQFDVSQSRQSYSHLWPSDEDRIRQAVDRALAQNAEDRPRTGVTTE
jgi:hypothetical protein